MSDLNLPGEPDPATDGDLQSSDERLADDVGTDPRDDGGEGEITVPTPPD